VGNGVSRWPHTVPAVYQAVGGLEVPVDLQVTAGDEEHPLYNVEDEGKPKVNIVGFVEGGAETWTN